MQNADLDDILAVTREYLDGLYEGDTAKLRDAFHPAAHLHSSANGELAVLPLEDWCRLVDGRASLKSQNFDRGRERILQASQTAPDCANVTLTCAAPGRLFTDHLSLVRLAGRWWIVNKSFHAEPTG